MRHGRRWASCGAGVLLVGLATLLSGGSQESHAQPGELKAAEPKGTLASPPSLPAGDLALPVANEPAPAAPAAPEDPEQAADTFVNQTRQQAEERVKALTAEADQLRARLKKVEAAIQRWQSLRAALDAKPGPGAGAEAAPPVFLNPVEDRADLPRPATLEPAPSAALPLPEDAETNPRPVISKPK